MKLNFQEFKREDTDLLYDFLNSDVWTFHSGGSNQLTKESVEKSISKGYYDGTDNKTFWIINPEEQIIGYLKIEDLEDLYPMFDLKVSSKYRGQGVGEKALRWLTDYIFNNYSEVHRVEGCTRQDNIGMRKVFKKCGYIKEGHTRKAWPPKDGTNYKEYYDSIRYGILRNDWEDGTTTLFNWSDDNF